MYYLITINNTKIEENTHKQLHSSRVGKIKGLAINNQELEPELTYKQNLHIYGVANW